MSTTRFVCTLPAQAARQARDFAARARAAGADLLEIRGDLTPGLKPFDSPLPLLLAPRGRDLSALLARGAAWLDVALGEQVVACPGAQRLGSWHDHTGTPPLADLLERAQALAQTGAAALKLVATPTGLADLWTLEQARRQLAVERPCTVLAMGPCADLSRLLSPWSNPLTYAALDPESRSAPGQWTLAQHRAHAGNQPPRLTGLLGGSAFTQRSLSPLIHDLLAQRHGLSSAYLRFPSDNPQADLEALRELGLRGLSVTAPHKVAAARACQQLDAAGRLTGAVNTLVRVDLTPTRPAEGTAALSASSASSSAWHGFQLDCTGLIRAYADWRGAQATALVGSGGSAAAVLLAARELDWRGLRLFARNRSAALALAERFAVQALPLEALPEADVDLLITTLPVDLEPALWPRPLGVARALDLRYRSPLDVASVDLSSFEQQARARGFTPRDGLAMLIHQALAQFERFHGVSTSAEDLAAVSAALAKPGRA
jgi:shikimate 5-dehydrogenase